MRFGLIKVALAWAFAYAWVASANATIGSCTDPILFGTTISETGPYSTLSEKWRRMTEVFQEEINAAGGLKLADCDGKGVPIKWVVYDDQSNPATATALYERMATVDKVDFFVGLDWSALGGPVPPIAEKHKIPLIASNIGTPALYERGLEYFWGTSFPTVPRWSERYFDMLATMDPKPKTIFFVTHDNTTTKAITEVWSAKAKEIGMEIVGSEMFSQDIRDFTALVTKMRSAKPDVIFISSYDNPSVPLIQQMRQLRVKATSVYHTMLSGALYRQVGDDIEGIFGSLSWYPGIEGPYSDLVERVLEKSGVNSFEYVWTISRVSAYLVAIQALERAGSVDREKVRSALYKGTFQSPAGDIVFGENGFSNNGAFTIQMQDGDVKIVWPPEGAGAQPQWPSPSWQ